ncbi:hypothetical protein, partial [Glaesserella parasuis]|uniref:hypothetical protein n=1 Tax=Glaesserella parasuis TaxID=738 RepID=UPI001BE49157
HAYATERVLALGTPKLWITLWFMLLVYYNFNIQGIGTIPFYLYFLAFDQSNEETSENPLLHNFS